MFNQISVAIYSIVNCLIVCIVIYVLRLEHNESEMRIVLSYHFCPVYCIILPRARDKMIQLTTHFEWLVSSTNAALCMYFFLPSCSQDLTMYYTSKSNKIYSVIKAGKKYLKKVDHLAPVSPIV